MRKIIIAVLIAILPTIGRSQEAQKFRAFQTELYDSYNSKINEKENLNILVVVSIENNKIDVYARETLHIDITDYLSTKDIDGGSQMKFKGVGNNGEIIFITLVLFNNPNASMHEANMMLTYTDRTSLLYRLKPNS